eukprot:49172-Eustigmatos_ZCMA.PRE.1
MSLRLRTAVHRQTCRRELRQTEQRIYAQQRPQRDNAETARQQYRDENIGVTLRKDCVKTDVR